MSTATIAAPQDGSTTNNNTTQTVTRWTKFEDLPEWISAREAAAILDLNPLTVYQLINQGEIPFRCVGKKRRIPRDYFNPNNAVKAVSA